jgi:hypothetical protein
MDDETLQRLSGITDQLIHPCDWLNENRDFATATRLVPIMDDITQLVAESGVKRNILAGARAYLYKRSTGIA